MLRVEDKRLTLPDGRILAYADNGNTSSSVVILFLHQALSVGDASHPSPIILERHLHFVAPSLPGWGHTSPAPSPTKYASTVISDMTALLAHLRPKASKIKLYICGHGFGTIAAQILYGAPFDSFPYGPYVADMVLVAPLSPPHCHREYSKHLSWASYFLTGPPARFYPFNCFIRVAAYLMRSKLKSPESAVAFTRTYYFDTMHGAEREALHRWQESRGAPDDQLHKDIAGNMIRSVAQTWQGFLDIARVYHSGWNGFDPKVLNGEYIHPDRKVIIIATRDDKMASVGTADWLVATYKNASLKLVDGGHMAGYMCLDEVWQDLLR